VAAEWDGRLAQCLTSRLVPACEPGSLRQFSGCRNLLNIRSDNHRRTDSNVRKATLSDARLLQLLAGKTRCGTDQGHAARPILTGQLS